MTSGPMPGYESENPATGTQQLYVYDAWNRLVEVWRDVDHDGIIDRGDPEANPVVAADDYLLAENRYDGQHRRVAKLVVVDGGFDENNFPSTYDRTDYYYDGAGRIVQEHYDQLIDAGDKELPASTLRFQYVWDVRYVDAPVCRDGDRNLDGQDCTDAATGTQSGNTGDEHLFYCQDANFNVTALVDSYDGAVVERYYYLTYGRVSVRHGVRDASGASTTDWASRLSTGTFQNELLFCGYRYDPETGLYRVGARDYHPTLGRWLQRDPAGYVDGLDLYEYVQGVPVGKVDPSGLVAFELEAKKRFMSQLGDIFVNKAPEGDSPQEKLRYRAYMVCGRKMQNKALKDMVGVLVDGGRKVSLLFGSNLLRAGKIAYDQAKKKLENTKDEKEAAKLKKEMEDLIQDAYDARQNFGHDYGGDETQSCKIAVSIDKEESTPDDEKNCERVKFVGVIIGVTGENDFGAPGVKRPKPFEFGFSGSFQIKDKAIVGWRYVDNSIRVDMKAAPKL